MATSSKLVGWRWGVPMDKPSGLAAANKGFTFDPAKVTVPALLIVGEGEYAERGSQAAAKGLHGQPAQPHEEIGGHAGFEEGATNHCVMENRSLMSQVLFDWLDDVLK